MNEIENLSCSKKVETLPDIYADVSFGENQFRNGVCYNVDLSYKDLDHMAWFADAIKQDRRLHGSKTYNAWSKANIYGSGKVGIVELDFESGTALNQYLKKFVEEYDVSVSIGNTDPLRLERKYDEKAALAKLADIRMNYIQNYLHNAGKEM